MPIVRGSNGKFVSSGSGRAGGRGRGALGISGRVKGSAKRNALAWSIRNERATDFHFGKQGERGGKRRGLTETAQFLRTRKAMARESKANRRRG